MDDEPLVETEVADSEPQRRSGPWKLIIVVAVLTMIGVWLVPGDDPQDDPTTAQPSTNGTDSTAVAPGSQPSLVAGGPGEQATTTEPAAESLPAVQEAIDDRPGAKARVLIASMRAEGDIDLERVFAAAQRSQIAGELADAYRLYFFAAREGSTPAALVLGKQADPATRDPLSSVFEDSDLTQAHKWYQIAAQNGSSEARDRLADLQARVEEMAASGDPQAQRISLLWQ